MHWQILCALRVFYTFSCSQVLIWFFLSWVNWISAKPRGSLVFWAMLVLFLIHMKRTSLPYYSSKEGKSCYWRAHLCCVLHVWTALIQTQESVSPQDSCALWGLVYPTFFSAEESSICFFRIADVICCLLSPTICKIQICFLCFMDVYTPAYLWTRWTTFHVAKHLSHKLHIQGAYGVFFITLCLQPASPLHFDLCPYPDIPLPKALISGNINHLKPVNEN